MEDDHRIFNKDDPFKEIEFEAEIETKTREEILEELEEQEQEEEQEQNPELRKTLKEFHKAHDQYQYWKSIFNDIFLEIYDAEKSFHDSKHGYTKELLNSGIRVDPNSLYDMIELINSRMTKIYTVKRMAHSMGLHHEWPKILEKELSLIYDSRSSKKED